MAKIKHGSAASLLLRLAEDQRTGGTKRNITLSLPESLIADLDTAKELTGKERSDLIIEVLEGYGFSEGVSALKARMAKANKSNTPQHPATTDAQPVANQ